MKEAWKTWYFKLTFVIATLTIIELTIGGLTRLYEWNEQRLLDREVKIIETFNQSQLFVELQDQVESVLRRQEEIRTILDELTPGETVAEYDISRSYVNTINNQSCVIGEPCSYVFRVKSTNWGSQCNIPSVELSQARVVNHGGLPHNVEIDAVFGQAPESQFINFRGTFVIPNSALAGIGEFYIALRYTGCPDARHPLDPTWENTPRLVFKILDNTK